jgi:hypothetical protein
MLTGIEFGVNGEKTDLIYLNFFRIPSKLEAKWIQKFCRKGDFKDSDAESLSDFI